MRFQVGNSAHTADDSDWEQWGTKDPYWAVLSVSKFRRDSLDASALTEFFSSGSAHIDHVLDVLRMNFRAGFNPSRSLDFGCGVGRLVIPLARHSQSAIGVDISSTMLAEAARNSKAQGVENIEFLRTHELNSIAPESLDLVHSFIVFQHISPNRGEVIIQDLLRKLRPGGLGALHVTIGRNLSPIKRMVGSVRRHSRLANGFCNLLQRRPVFGPVIHMYNYDLNSLIWLMHAAGCGRKFAEFVENGDVLGIMIYFEKLPLS